MTRPLTLLLLIVAFSLSAVGADHTLGTWKYNAEKSKPAPGTPPYKSLTVMRTAAGDGIQHSAQGERTGGGKIDLLGTYRYDGKPTRLAKYGNWDTISAKQIDANNVSEERTKSGGKYRANAVYSTSVDGRTMTVTAKGVDEQGKPFTSVAVFDRQ